MPGVCSVLRRMDLPPALKLDQLRTAVQAKTVDTVLLALTDMQGRLQGKRLTAAHFLETVVEHGAEACNYLLAVDVEMNTVDGYAMSSWERGYGDFAMHPDLGTLRITAWDAATALVIADLRLLDHGSTPVAPSPRQILRRQTERLAERGCAASATRWAPPGCAWSPPKASATSASTRSPSAGPTP